MAIQRIDSVLSRDGREAVAGRLRQNVGVRYKLMQWVTIVAAALAFLGGAMLEWWKGWIGVLSSNRAIRRSIAVELSQILVTLNFYVTEALGPDPLSDYALLAKYFPKPLRLRSFSYFWFRERGKVLRLPEWRLLYDWADSLPRIGTTDKAPLFQVLMLCQALAMPPLNQCLNRELRGFVNRILNLPGAQTYRLNCLQHGGQFLEDHRSPR